MALSRRQMLTAFMGRDRRYDGRFVTGVSTTGIFCLPSCSARKPKRENVRFFDGPELAIEGGFRACRRCRPDRFYSDEDPDKRRLFEVIGRLRADPVAVSGVDDLARAVEVGKSKLTELVRRHCHRTPADLLARLRVGRAARLLYESDRPVADIAFDVGFGTLSAFGANVRRFTCLSPAGYRALRAAREFELRLPTWLALEPLFRYWGRDPGSLTEQVADRRLRFALAIGRQGTPALLEVQVDGGVARCQVSGPRRLPETAAREAHRTLVRLFGLDRDPRTFERRAAALPRMAELVAGQRGLVVPRTRDVFEGLLWVIAGQQVSLASAFAMRRRLIARTGRAVTGGLIVPPSPEVVANLSAEDLRGMGFSARKAEVVLAAAADTAAGRLETEVDFAAATTVERSLLERAGFGPWSVGYLMMRAWGFADCVPLGDVALMRRLAEVYDLAERPDPAATLRLLAPLAPDRSLATFHFWHKPAGVT